MIKRIFVALLLLSPLLAWEGFETKHFVIYFPPGREGEALRALTYLENYYERVGYLTGNYRRKTIVVIQDMGLYSNGFTDPFVPSIHLFVSPPYPSPEFGAMRSWWREVSIHEFTHAAHLSRVDGIPSLVRLSTGRALLPNLFLPQFLTEGIAVYSESTLVPLEGRLNEGFYQAYMQSASPFKLSFLMGEPAVYPFYSMRYIYGGEFAGFLVEKYGEEALTHYISLYSSSFTQALGISTGAYKKAFGKSLSSLYRDFSKNYRSEETVDSLFSADDILWLGEKRGKLYVSTLSVKLPFPYFLVPTYKIVEYDLKTGKTRNLVSEPVALPFKFDGENLYYARPETGRGFKNKINQGYGEVREIIEFNTRTGQRERITRGLIKAFAVKGKKFIYSIPMGCCGSKLILLDTATGSTKVIFSSESLEIYDIAWGKKIVLGGRKDGEGSDLYLLENGSLKRLTATPFTETNLRWTEEGLVFSANPEGRWEPYLWDGTHFYRLASTSFCESPMVFRDKVYCIGLSSGKKVVFKRQLKKEPVKWEKSIESYSPEIPEFKRVSAPYNFLSLLTPDVYFFSEDENNEGINFNFFSHDARDENFYMFVLGMDKNHRARASFEIYSLSISPFILNLKLKTGSEAGIILGTSSPVFRSRRKFLRELYFNLDFGDRLEDERRTSISLSSDFFFADRANIFNIFLHPEFQIEDKAFGSSLNRRGYFIETGLFFPLSTRTGIQLNAFYGNDRDNPEGISFNTYSWGSFTAKEGLLLYGEFSLRLANIRRGIANPHIFFDGLYASVFSEIYDGKSDRQSIGAFLSLELSTYHGLLKIYPMAGAAYRFDERKWVSVIGINGFLFPVDFRKRINPFKKIFSSDLNKYIPRRWVK